MNDTRAVSKAEVIKLSGNDYAVRFEFYDGSIDVIPLKAGKPTMVAARCCRNIDPDEA